MGKCRFPSSFDPLGSFYTLGRNPHDFALNLVVYFNLNTSIFQKLDPLTSLLKASAQWEKRIHKSLNSMCTDLETSLAKIRPQSEQEELSEKWNELSTYNLGNFSYKLTHMIGGLVVNNKL